MQTEGTQGTNTAMQHKSTGTVLVEHKDNGVVVIRLGSDEERVISITEERLLSLEKVVEELHAKPPKGVVLLSSREDMFTVGADISLIQSIENAEEGEAAAMRGQSIFSRLEMLPCNTVAAISGPCLGGGCELALSCSHRIITGSDKSQIGLPEIKIGILPGFGGTQRLPRLVGLPKALDVILAGKSLRPKQALACGLVDKIVAFDELEKIAMDIALGIRKPSRQKPGIIDRFLTYTGVGRNIVYKKALAKVRKTTKGFYPAPLAALESVFNGLKSGLEGGLRYEAKKLGELIVTKESKNLVHLFFLTEASKNLGKQAKAEASKLHAVVVGAGTMGAGIAGSLAKNDSQVILKDTSNEALSRGKQHVQRYLKKLRYLSEQERNLILNRIETTTGDSNSLGNANFVIEAIFEEMTVKKEVLRDLSKKVSPEALIATNTSSLSVTEIASAIDNPERVIGMHFFNPVEKMPLVEIVRAEQSSSKTICVTAALAQKLGKFPIVVEDVPGFLVNRILTPYMNEAAFLLSEGYRIKDIDRAATKFGMPMGPIRLLDEVGLDVATHVSQTMVEGYGDRMQAPHYASILVEAGRKGKKNNAGFYDYQDTDEQPHHEIRSLLGIEAKEQISPDVSLIQDRLILSLVNEAILCLDEGVAGIPGKEAAGQIDLGTVMGTGFPPFHGGLIHYAEQRGVTAIEERLRELEKQCGPRFKPVKGIIERSRLKKSFYEAL